MPTDDEGNKSFGTPPPTAIHRCSPRVEQMIELVSPKLIVLVGKIAEAAYRKLPKNEIPTISILHPAAILRADISQKGLAIQRTVIALSEAVLTPAFQNEPKTKPKKLSKHVSEASKSDTTK
jgi:uracil-DNA glycosylase